MRLFTHLIRDHNKNRLAAGQATLPSIAYEAIAAIFLNRISSELSRVTDQSSFKHEM